jgi:hypothetical protein
MNLSAKAILVLLLLSPATKAVAEEHFRLGNSQNIACSRDLSRGKLKTATCSSFAYLFNTKTSEYFRCKMSLSVTRDKKAVLIVHSDGHCARKPRIFPGESDYELDATETQPPNLNSFFGSGGHAVWAADTTQQRVRGCMSLSSDLGAEVTRCMDMKFD